MDFVFCKSCGQSMASSSSFCEQCGTPAGLDLPASLSLQTPPRASRISSFFASQAMLCLFTLLVFSGLVIALAPAGWRYASLQFHPSKAQDAATATNDSYSLGVSNTSARCSQIVVVFTATATVARVSALLKQLNTTIDFGPNENGAFELATSPTLVAEVADALNRTSDAVVAASLQRRCL